MVMQTKTQRKKATSGVKVTASKPVRSPSRGDGGESTVSKSKQLLLDEQYRDLFDNTSDLIQSVAPDGHFLYVNKAWRDTLGYSEKEVAHLKIWDIISPESMDHCMELFKKVIAGEDVRDIEAVFVAKDGSRITVEGNAHCRFVEGKPVGTQGLFRDVTERKRAEETLQASAQQWQTTFDAISDAVFLLDSKGMILGCNNAAIALVGKPYEKILGGSYWEVVQGSPEPMEGCPLMRMLKSHCRETLTFPINNRWLHATADPVLDKAGNLLGAVYVVVDVTEGKEAEEALRQSEERYRTLFDSKLDGMCVMDETMKVLLVNQAAADIFGFDSIDEALGTNPFDLIPPEERERVLDVIKKDMFERDLRQVNEFRLTNKSGKDIWVSAIGALIEYQGKLAGLISFRDITKRKQIEKSLQFSRFLLDSTDGAMVCVDQEGRFIDVNDAECRATGYSREELLSMTVHDIDPNYSAEVWPEFWKKLKQSGSLIFESQHRSKKGRIIPVEILATYFEYDGKGYHCGFARDITERKRAEEELQESEEKFRSVFDNNADAIFLTIPDGRIIAANPASFRIFGYTEEEFRQYGRNAILDANDPSVKTALEQRARTGGFQGELTFKRKDGTKFPGEISSFVFKDKKGQSKTSMMARDITERKQAEESLRQSEERYRTVLEEMEEGYFETDISGNFTVINETTCRVLGYPREEIIGTNYRVFVTKEYVDAVYQVFNQIYQTGTPIRQLAWEILGKDGGRKFIEASVSPLRDQEGQLIGFRGIGRDITERKKVELALQQEKERTQKYLDIAAVMLMVLDADGKVSVINRRGCEILGYKAEDIVGKSWFNNFIPHRIRRKVRAVFKKLMSGEVESIGYFENPVVTKSGEERLIAWHNSLIKNDTGKFVAVLSSGEDITERKKAEEALQDSEERYRALFDRSLDCVYLHDFEGNFLDANDAALKLLGYDREEISHLNFSSLLSEDQLPKALAAIEEVRDTGTLRHAYEFRLRRKDGEYVDVESTASAIYHGGKPYATQGVVRDLTERKKAEQALRLSEQNLRDSIENSPLGIRVIDKDWKTLYINRALLDMWGYSSIEEFEAVSAEQRYTPEGYAEHIKITKRRKQGEDAPINYEASIVRSDGQVRRLSASTRGLLWNGERQFQAVYQDITERKQAEERIKKLYSLQTAIRYVNESLLKVDDEQALFEQVCHFLTDVEFIRFCWIGLTDKESLEVKPVAYSGFEDGYLSSLKIRLSGSAYNRGPIGVAIKTRQPCIVADIENDPRFTGRREAAFTRGYASSLAVPLIHDAEVIGVLSVYSGSRNDFGDAEIDFLTEAARDIALGINTLRLRRELQQSLSSLGKALEGTVNALASVAEVRDPYTAGHQKRVTRLAVAIATEMGLPQEQIEGIHVAGTLHDVGKLYIPAEILSKPGKLSEVEFSLVKMHSQAGYDILKTVEFPWPIAQIVLQHHERLDGSGYPQGLRGEDILLEAKILAVSDVVEAMASHRPYRPALGIGQALDEISQKSGILYDFEVVDACFKLFYDKEFKLD
jgi:PAS domain S-box-containing protein